MESINSIQAKLCKEIALAACRKIESVDPESALSDNGLDSMTFLQLLIFIKQEWKIDFLAEGIALKDFSSVTALAAVIQDKLQKQQ